MLSRGLLTGSRPAGPADVRSHFPRFHGDNLAHNRKLVATSRRSPPERAFAPAQLALAWVLAKGVSIVPVVGARTRTQLADSLRALDVKLTEQEIAALESAIPPQAAAGTRYGQEQMRTLDSEK